MLDQLIVPLTIYAGSIQLVLVANLRETANHGYQYETVQQDRLYIPELGNVPIIDLNPTLRACVDPRKVVPLLPAPTWERIPLEKRERRFHPASAVKNAGGSAGIIMQHLRQYLIFPYEMRLS